MEVGGGVVGSAHLAVDGFVPAEAGQFKVGTVVTIDHTHAVWRIGGSGIVLFRSRRKGLCVGIGKDGEAQLGAGVGNETDGGGFIAQKFQMSLFGQGWRVTVLVQFPLDGLDRNNVGGSAVLIEEVRFFFSFCNSLFKLFSIVGIGIVPCTRRRDVPALEVGVLWLFAMHILIFFGIFGHLLWNGIGIEQRTAFEIDALTFEGLLLQLHGEVENDFIALLDRLWQTDKSA